MVLFGEQLDRYVGDYRSAELYDVSRFVNYLTDYGAI